MKDLQDKRVLVTGSGRGIGRAIAGMAIERGARVVISDLDPESAEKAAADLGAAGVANCDVTDEQSVVSAVDRTVGILGGLDILVNNAGIEISVPLVEQSTESFDHIFAVNVRGPFVAMKAATRTWSPPAATSSTSPHSPAWVAARFWARTVRPRPHSFN